MKAIEIACRRCAAQPHEVCMVSGTDIKLTTAFHAERIEDAGYLTENASPVGKNAFDLAVENSGLV